MAVELVLHSIDGPFVAFNIDHELWFMRLEPIPRIYSEDLKPQQISNLDSWFQAKTHQQYSLQTFRYVVAAFRAGLAKSYSAKDLNEVAQRTTLVAKAAIMERMGEYSKHFWVEVLDPVKLETVWVPQIRNKFDELRGKLGDDGFHNYLCRLWKFASKHRPGLTIVFERFINRLGREPVEPRLPSTDDLDAELCRHVLATVFDRQVTSYRNVPSHVQERLEILNGRQ